MFDPEDEPDGDVSAPHHFWIGIGTAVFAFATVWQYYPTIGSIGVLVGLAIALDDAVEHSFDVPTPLDELWKRAIYPLVARIERGSETEDNEEG